MYLVDDRMLRMFRWNQALCVVCVLMAIAMSALTGILVISVRDERGAHLVAIQNAQKTLEAKDQDLALARQHVAYLDKFVTQFHKDGWHMKAVKPSKEKKDGF